MKPDPSRHEILIRTTDEGGLEVRCGCGIFLLDRQPGLTGLAQVSLVEITTLVTAHYISLSRPEKGNGSIKLIPGRK